MTKLVYTGRRRPGRPGLAPMLIPGRTYEVEEERVAEILAQIPDLKRADEDAKEA